MRKPRDGITFSEWYEWAITKRGDCMWSRLIEESRNMFSGRPSNMEFPDSFYQQPPAGSFGLFSDASPTHKYWGYLGTVDESRAHRPFQAARTGAWWKSFVPGLPPDVDKDGLPK